jgi:hypothetical protein
MTKLRVIEVPDQATVDMKLCPRCQQPFPKSEFGEFGRGKYCADCGAITQKEYRQTYRRARKAKQTREERKTEHLWKNFKLSADDYNRMYREQDGLCMVCQKPGAKLWDEVPAHKKLCVDHCHTTGEVRGLLCRKCNSVLGLANDDPKVLMGAINYLLPRTSQNDVMYWLDKETDSWYN